MEVEKKINIDSNMGKGRRKTKNYITKTRTKKSKEYSTLEGKLALRTAVSLESLQNLYIDIHNQIISQIYEYLNEIEYRSNELIDLALERAFLQVMINQLTEYLSEVRRKILHEMSEIIEIFNEKLKNMYNLRSPRRKVKEDINLAHKAPIFIVEDKSKSIPPMTSDLFNNTKDIPVGENDLFITKKTSPISSKIVQSSNTKFSGYDFDINEFEINSQNLPYEDRIDLSNNNCLNEDIWCDFLLK